MSKKEQERADLSSLTIADLRGAIEDLVLRGKQPGEGIMIEARQLAREWKVKGRPLFDGSMTNTVLLLVALVAALKREHELLEQIRRHLPVELEELQGAILHAQMREIGEALARTQAKPKRWQPFEEKRRRWHRNFYNSIEYQYGGGLVADLRKSAALGGLRDDVLQWLGATCLDDVFRGDALGKVTTRVNFYGGPLMVVATRTNMQSLEDLFFGIGRKRLAKLLSGKKKRRYWRDVIQIMAGLLKERPRKRRRKSKPGPARRVWPNDEDVRERVLKGIEARLKSFPARGEIKSAFNSIIHDYLQGIGKR